MYLGNNGKNCMIILFVPSVNNSIFLIHSQLATQLL